MRSIEILMVISKALVEFCKARELDSASHRIELHPIMDDAGYTHFTVKSHDGTVIKTYKITVELARTV